MFKNTLLKILTIFFLLISFSIKKTNKLIAQEIIEEGQSKKKSDNYWDKHFKATFGTSFAKIFDGKSYRSFSYASLTYKEDSKWINFNLEVLAYRRDFQYFLVLDPEDRKETDLEIQALDAEVSYKKIYDQAKATGATPQKWDPSYNRQADDICGKTQTAINPYSNFGQANTFDPQTNLNILCANRSRVNSSQSFGLGITDNQALWREANIVLKFGEKAQLLLGNHTVVWGQLDFLSPIDFWLPLRLGTSGLGLTKADNRNPQTMALLTIFPVSWIELQFYLFPDTGIDPLFLNNLISRNSSQNSEYYNYQNTKIPTGKDLFRYAGRALFYLDKITLGFTWYQGFFQFAANSNSTLYQDTKYDQIVYKFRGAPELERINVYGFEFAYPMGKWILKDDFAYTQLFSDFSSFDLKSYNNQSLGFLSKDKLFDKRQTYINWIFQKNGGRLGVLENYIVNSIGVDSNQDKWLFNISLLIFYTSRSSESNIGRKLALEAQPPTGGGNPFGSSDISAVPAFNIAYYLNAQKKDAVGVAGGFLNSGVGLIGYYGAEVYESLRLALSLEYLLLFGNGLVNIPGYKLNNPAFPAVRLTFDYNL